MKYHILYETTCLVNGKRYRGMHSSNSLNDKYLGSGVALSADIKKYGRENFYRENLSVHKNRQGMIKAEREAVNEEWVRRSDTYNLVIGGGGSEADPTRIKPIDPDSMVEVEPKIYEVSVVPGRLSFYVVKTGDIEEHFPGGPLGLSNARSFIKLHSL